MKRQLALIFAIFFCMTNARGQKSITIFKITDPTKERKIYLGKILDLKTIDSVYINEIIDFKQNDFFVLKRYYNKEIKYFYTNKEKTDSTYNTYWHSAVDTVNIPSDKITSIKYFPNKGKRWPILFGIFAAMSVVSIISIPLNAINHHEKGQVLENTLVVGGLLAITVPIALIGLRTDKYDMKNKWKLKQLD